MLPWSSLMHVHILQFSILTVDSDAHAPQLHDVKLSVICSPLVSTCPSDFTSHLYQRTSVSLLVMIIKRMIKYYRYQRQSFYLFIKN